MASQQKNHEPARKMPLWKRLRKSAQDFYSLNRWLSIVFGVTLIAVCFQVTLVGLGARENSVAATALREQQPISLGDLQEGIDQKKVTALTVVTVNVGSFVHPRPTTFLAVEFGKSPSGVVELPPSMEFHLLESIGKSLSAIKAPLTQGYDYTHGIAFDGFMKIFMWMLMIVMVLIVAQNLMGEILAGHSFKPALPDRDLLLKDVIGCDELKDELREIIDQIQNPDEYARQGIAAPRGLLLTGDPGVGKTMLARALANEIQVAFFSCSAADFVEMYVGVGARRVRSLFQRARMAGRAVIFIDEFDALGSRESRDNNSERLQTINMLLSELDGMSRNPSILVVAATNHADWIDPALRRPGRFDRIVKVPLPDTAARKAILERYLQGKPCEADLDLETMARRTLGYSGAQLRQVAEEGAKIAWRQKRSLTLNDLVDAQVMTVAGPFKSELTDLELRTSIVHELGHALVGHRLCPDMKIDRVSVGGAGAMLGYTLMVPNDAHRLRSRESLLGEIAMLLGGRAAEAVILNAITTGGSDDLQRANRIAREMVAQLGMGPTGSLLVFDPRAPEVRETVDQHVTHLLETEFQRAKSILRSEMPWIASRRQALMEKRVLSHEELFGPLGTSLISDGGLAHKESTPAVDGDLAVAALIGKAP